MLAMSGVRGATYNVAINVKGLTDRTAGTAVLDEAGGVERQAAEASSSAAKTVSAALA